MPQVTATHKRFLNDLDGSRHSMFVVAEWLHGQGYSVEIPAFRKAPTAADHAEYSDDGDVFVFVHWHYDVRRRYEIKNLSVCFTSRSDWPFGNRIYVDRAAKVERAAKDVIGWITVSSDFGALAIIPSNTSEHWRKIEVFNKKSNRWEWTYSCPLAYATFELLPRYGP
jgi:hypothetical protein